MLQQDEGARRKRNGFAGFQNFYILLVKPGGVRGAEHRQEAAARKVFRQVELDRRRASIEKKQITLPRGGVTTRAIIGFGAGISKICKGDEF